MIQMLILVLTNVLHDIICLISDISRQVHLGNYLFRALFNQFRVRCRLGFLKSRRYWLDFLKYTYSLDEFHLTTVERGLRASPRDARSRRTSLFTTHASYLHGCLTKIVWPRHAVRDLHSHGVMKELFRPRRRERMYRAQTWWNASLGGETLRVVCRPPHQGRHRRRIRLLWWPQWLPQFFTTNAWTLHMDEFFIHARTEALLGASLHRPAHQHTMRNKLCDERDNCRSSLQERRHRYNDDLPNDALDFAQFRRCHPIWRLHIHRSTSVMPRWHRSQLSTSRDDSNLSLETQCLSLMVVKVPRCRMMLGTNEDEHVSARDIARPRALDALDVLMFLTSWIWIWTLDIDIRSRHDGTAERGGSPEEDPQRWGPCSTIPSSRRWWRVSPSVISPSTVAHRPWEQCLESSSSSCTCPDCLSWSHTLWGDDAHDELRERRLQKTCFTSHWQHDTSPSLLLRIEIVVFRHTLPHLLLNASLLGSRRTGESRGSRQTIRPCFQVLLTGTECSG